MKYRITSIILTIYMLTGILGEVWAQCASCKAAAATTDENGDLVVGAGLNTGILYLLALPFLTMGFILLRWYLKTRQLKAQTS